jgi:hypothetical protein
MNIRRLLIYIRKGDLAPFYTWFLGKSAWPLLHRDLGKANAIRVMKEDWDYLIVLDACRYDTFKEVVDEGANYVISGGTDTQSWLDWNFGEKYEDVIYIAGNPHFASAHLRKTLGFNPFYAVEEVWDYGWDNNIKTVPPEQVTDAALRTIQRYPEKRMIVHYNQPHRPYLSDKELRDDGKRETIWDLVRRGEVSIERIRTAYKENLRIVMKEVERLQKQLSGRVILTADHGDLFGEWGLYGHVGRLRVEGLVKVPWVTLKEEKKQVPYREPDVEKSRVTAKVMKLRESGRL